VTGIHRVNLDRQTQLRPQARNCGGEAQDDRFRVLPAAATPEFSIEEDLMLGVDPAQDQVVCVLRFRLRQERRGQYHPVPVNLLAHGPYARTVLAVRAPGLRDPEPGIIRAIQLPKVRDPLTPGESDLGRGRQSVRHALADVGGQENRDCPQSHG
jgi:hypothetical protein